MTPDERRDFMARLVLDEALPAEVDAFVAWAAPRFPEGPRLRQLAGYRPITDELALAFLAPALQEAGLTPPAPLDAAVILAYDVMGRIATGELGPEAGAAEIDRLSAMPGLDPAAVIATPQLQDFRARRQDLRAARDVGDDDWFVRTLEAIEHAAEHHLGLR